MVEFDQRVLHVGVGGELDDSLVPSQLVCVRVGDFAGLPHEIFEVLPAHAAAQVFHEELVLGAAGRAVPARAACSAVAGARPTADASRQFDRDAFAHQLLTVEIVHRVFGVTVVVELDEAVAVFEQDFTDAAVAFEELLQVPFSHIVVEATHKHTGRHGGSMLSPIFGFVSCGVSVRHWFEALALFRGGLDAQVFFFRDLAELREIRRFIQNVT